jgi:hypothetical protein
MTALENQIKTLPTLPLTTQIPYRNPVKTALYFQNWQTPLTHKTNKLFIYLEHLKPIQKFQSLFTATSPCFFCCLSHQEIEFQS